MNWYYAEDGQQRGPISEAELAALVQNGKVTASTLVWQPGMANWQPYGQVGPAAIGAGPVSSEVGGQGAEARGAAVMAEVVCSECGRVVPSDQAIQYGEAWVCANCKPLFVQKLKEGAAVAVPGARVYGGFWIRFVAKFLDQLILGVASLPIGLLLGFTFRGDDLASVLVQQGLAWLIGIALGMAYNGWFVGRFGATPGKMALRLKIVTADGGTVSYGRAIGRFFAEMLSGCPTLLIGYIMAGFDEEKRALHDRICNTRVIRQ